MHRRDRILHRRRDLHVTYGDIVRKYAGKAPSQPGRVGRVRRRVVGGAVSGSDIEVRHLSSGVHARIGTTGDGQPRRRGETQDDRERLGKHTLDGSPARLGGPPGEVGAVVGEVEAETDEPATLNGRPVAVRIRSLGRSTIPSTADVR